MYGALRVPCVRTSTLSKRRSLLLQASLSPQSRLFLTSTQLRTVDSTKDAVIKVSGGLGALVSPATLLKLVVNRGPIRSYTSLPPKPCHPIHPRADEVRRIFAKFNALEKNNPSTVVKTVYITGSPGSGKSQLAGQFGREVFERNKPQNKNLFVGTLSADNCSIFLDTYLQTAIGVGCVNQATEWAIRSGQLGELQSLKMLSDHVKKELRERPEWLLIIDGLSSDERLVKKLSCFWPQPKEESWGKGGVLVTTQGQVPMGSCMDVMDLRSGMSEKDAVELLTKISGCSDKEGAVELVNSLDKSPLSVANAGLYIRNERSRNPSYTFKDYLNEVVLKGTQNMSEGKLSKHPYQHTRKEAVSMTANQIVSNDPNMRKVFVLLAACAQAPVPLSLVARVLGLQPDSRQLEDVCSCPLLSPLISGLGEIETLSVHQVTRSVFKDLFLKDISTSAVFEQRNDLVHIIADCLCQEYDAVYNTFHSHPGTVLSFQMMRLLIPHMEYLLQIQSKLPDFCLDANQEVKLNLTLGKSYHHMGKINEAREVLEKAQRVCIKEGIKDTKEDAEVAGVLGSIYGDVGMYQESQHILKEALGILMNCCGEESVEVAKVLHSLGETYFRMEEFKESRESCEHALEIYVKIYGHKNPSVAAVLASLGNNWKHTGDKDKAITTYQKALTIQEEIYGLNHLEVALTLNNLGNVMKGKQSLELLKRALEIKKHVYGEDHPNIARTLLCLSETYHDMGDIHQAKKMAQDAFLLLQSTHDPPLMAAAQYNLGKINLELEEFVDSQHHLQSSFATHKLVYGVKDKRTTRAHLGAVVAARLAGNIKHAKEVLERAEETSLDTSETLAELGKVYYDLGYLTQSRQFHTRALELLNPDKAKLQITFRQADLAQVLWESGEVTSALEMMQQALKDYQQLPDTVSEEDSVTIPELEDRISNYVSMLVAMSQMHQDTGNLREARGYLKNALQKLKKSTLSHNLLEAKTLCTIGTVFHHLAVQPTTALNPVAARVYPWYYRYKARKLLNNALDTMRKVRNTHPNTATILAAIGRLDLESGDLHSAKLHLVEALDIQTKCCGYIHPKIALYHQLLAKVASQNGDELSAKSHLQEVDKTYSALIKREGEQSERADIKLPILQKWQKMLGNRS